MPNTDIRPVAAAKQSKAGRSRSKAAAPRSTAAKQIGPKKGSRLAAELDERLAGIAALEDRIEAIARAVPGRVAFSTSLGIEDQAVLHAISLQQGTSAPAKSARASIDVFTLDTGRHFPETLETLADSERRYGLKIRVVAPKAREVESLVARDGIFGFRHAVENRIACCDVRKVRPLNRALKGAAGWLTGLRRAQSGGRADVPFAAFDTNLGLIKLNPIADWSLEKLEAYIEAHDVPINPLHANGYPSIGCQPCTRAISPGEDIRAGRWWWENEDGKECGLHNRPANVAAKGALS
jgi:phosphoadenosine phosphosulfate reductase